MKFLVLNGPNLNMLGIREPEVYGKNTYEELLNMINEHAKKIGVEVECYQSNHEGDLVEQFHKAYFDNVDGIVINPAAYTHTSVALLDAVKAVAIPTVEVHITDIDKREDFRQINYIRKAVIYAISGQGFDGYIQALDHLVEYLGEK